MRLSMAMYCCSSCFLVMMAFIGSAAAAQAVPPLQALPSFSTPLELLTGQVAFNERMTVAVAHAAASGSVHVLRRQGRTWQPAGELLPPDTSAAHLGQGSLVLSRDGRLLAATADAHVQVAHDSRPVKSVVIGYMYRVGPGRMSGQPFSYQLLQPLKLPAPGQLLPDAAAAAGGTAIRTPPSTTSNQYQSSSVSSGGAHSRGSSRLDMSEDGRTVVGCFTVMPRAGGSVRPAAATSGGAAVFTWAAGHAAKGLRVHSLPLPKGSASFGSSCKSSRDGGVVLVVDAARGAMVYRRNSHGRHAAVHRASGWLAGGTPRERYNISAAALSPCGRFAVLKVHHLHKRASSLLVVQPEGQTVLKLFAADGFGQWSSSCEIAVLQGHGPGPVSLSLVQGTLQVTAAAAGSSTLRYAAAVDGAGAVTHCPTQPVMTTQLTGTDAAAGAGAVLTANDSSSTRGSQVWRRPATSAPGLAIRSGKLKTAGAEAVYVSQE